MKYALPLAMFFTAIVISACGPSAPVQSAKPKIGVIIDADGENDKSFNQYTLKGARDAAAAVGLDLAFLGSQPGTDFEQQIEKIIAEGATLVVTVGFRQADATAKSARRHPDIKFAILDTAYFPGAGCQKDVKDCYSAEGGLSNVTSLMFAEDQVGYLAGVLAGCMSKSGTIATVAGVEIPPVVRYVTGFQNGARSVAPNLVTLNQYIPDFNDPATGKVIGQSFILQGADVIFGVGGNTGNGGLLAAKDAGVMAIGVDVDQYFTFPEVQATLISSAAKHVDVSAADAVKDFAAGRLTGGIRTATLTNGGVGLTPFHDWDSKVPQGCKDKIQAAESAIKSNPSITGVK